ncbi:hypothetical protein M8818_001511 [Zalaria obscura]|uniref:Uncharacterized protein n=1 Tax=Zalaria obscura TaxID=2024903 RepID=A0ACC3SKG1_9PEZI
MVSGDYLVGQETIERTQSAISTIRSRKPIGPFSHPLTHQKTSTDVIVGFDGPDDPYRPLNWAFKKKVMTTALYGFTTMGATFASSVYSPAVNQIAGDYNVGSEVSLLGVSLLLFGFGVGPLIWAPLSEVYGRKPAVLIPYFIAAVFSFGTAAAKDIQTICITRFFTGLFGSAPVTNTGGVLGDIWAAEQRGVAIVGYAMAVVGGPTLGPIVGGAIVQSYLRWRWTQYRFYFKRFRANNNRPVPEARLPPMMAGSVFFAGGLFVFAWTSSPDIHWIAPNIGAALIGIGFFTVFQSALNYLIDTFTQYSASAVAANTFLRSALAGAFPLFITPMLHKLGPARPQELCLTFCQYEEAYIPGSRRREQSVDVRRVDRRLSSLQSSVDCPVSKGVEYSFLRRWLHECQEEHENCKTLTRSIPAGMNLIDTNTGAICPASAAHEYAALSYVWGDCKQPVPQRDRHDRIVKLPAGTPDVVVHSMKVARKLGLQYLWIDNHCIDYKNTTTLHEQLRDMATRYQQACVTFVMAAGNDRDMILGGRSKPLRGGQEHGRTKRIFSPEDGMTCSEGFDGSVAKSLGFTTSTRPTKSNESGGAMMAEYQIWEHVKAYTGRNLSHEEDSLNGLLGTLDSFHFLSPPIEQYWGLPVAKSFEESLCWVHGLSVFPIRRSGFPSWSWTGWRGKVEPFDLPSTKQEGHVQFCAGLKDGRHIPFGCHDFTSEVSPHLMMETWQFLGNFAEYPQVGDDYDHKSPEVHNSDWSLVSNLTRLPACGKTARDWFRLEEIGYLR